MCQTSPYKEWADTIASKLSDEQLNAFALLLDGDSEDEFYLFLNELNAQRNPGSYEKELEKRYDAKVMEVLRTEFEMEALDRVNIDESEES